MTSSIAQFYTHRSVFLTGATGFLGKVLIEKLLRCCPEINKIYILMRAKKGQNVKQRTVELLNSKVFESIHTTNPSVLEKVIPVEGDILLPQLDLSSVDRRNLYNNVSIIFHAAANIRFDDPLMSALKMNVCGTQKVLELAKNVKDLVALVHVSTAFSNCNRDNIDETIYEPPIEPSKILPCTEWMESDTLQVISDRLVDKWVTTYHFTKAITESLLLQERGTVPMAIVRPSVVVGAEREPLPGWTETQYHINGILIGCGRGVFRVLHCDPMATLDIVPVDTVISLIVSSAWDTSTKSPEDEPTVYNCVSGVDRPLTYKQLQEYSIPVMRENPILYPINYPTLHLARNRISVFFLFFFLHWLPAFILDGCLRLCGMEPKLVRVMRRIERGRASNEFFLLKDFHFTNDNVRKLWSKLSAKDKTVFKFDLSQLDWKSYLQTYFLGCKQYVCNESLTTLPKARRQMMGVRWLYNFLYTICSMPIAYVFYVKVVCNQWLFSQLGILLRFGK